LKDLCKDDIIENYLLSAKSVLKGYLSLFVFDVYRSSLLRWNCPIQLIAYPTAFARKP